MSTRMPHVWLLCGLGGAGKTTTAAAFGVGLARTGRRVVVLTIDPARRLADALGMTLEGTEPTPIPLDDIPGAQGSLHALMLDRKATWDEIVRRCSPSDEVAQRLLDNRYYRAVSTRLTGSHEYMAVEKLHELVESGHWDAVIVDTPPAQHAREFLRAPERMRRVLDRRVMGVLTTPGRGLLGSTTRRISKLVQRLIGERVLGDISEFFDLFSGMSGSIVSRNRAVDELLRSEQTHFLLVAAATSDASDDALAFVRELRDRGLPFEGFIVNRMRPAAPDPTELDLPPAPEDVDIDAWRVAMRRVREMGIAAHQAGLRDAAAASALGQTGDAPVWTLPDVPGGVADTAGLAALAQRLPPAAHPLEGQPPDWMV